MAKITSNPPIVQQSTLPSKEAKPFLSVDKVIEHWQQWNTSRISSSERQNRKLQSLESLAKELACKDPAVSENVERVTKNFFAQGHDKKSANPVQTLLNHYRNFVDEISDHLEELADEQLVSNTWRSS